MLAFNVGKYIHCWWYVGIVGIPQSGLSGQQKNPSHDHMLHCGMLHLKKKNILNREATICCIVKCYKKSQQSAYIVKCHVWKNMPSWDTVYYSMLHCGMLYLKTNIPGRDATCYELQHATQLSGVQILDHLRTKAVLTLQDDNNGTGNDIGIERKRYHGKELVSRWNFSLSRSENDHTCLSLAYHLLILKVLDHLKPKAHTEWKALGFASDDLLRFYLIFWLLDCPIKEHATPFHLPHLYSFLQVKLTFLIKQT